MEIEIHDVVDLSFRNGRVVYLSDLKPVSVREQPFLDDAMPFRSDQSVLGHPLRLGGRVYTKGLGVRSFCGLAYQVEGFHHFEATFGLDESAGPFASVRFLVKVDGQTSFESPEMLASSAPKQLHIGLKTPNDWN